MNIFKNILGSPKTSAAGVGTVIAGILADYLFKQFGVTVPVEVIAGAVALAQTIILMFVKGAPKV